MLEPHGGVLGYQSNALSTENFEVGCDVNNGKGVSSVFGNCPD
jgi:hypothetical protein